MSNMANMTSCNNVLLATDLIDSFPAFSYNQQCRLFCTCMLHTRLQKPFAIDRRGTSALHCGSKLKRKKSLFVTVLCPCWTTASPRYIKFLQKSTEQQIANSKVGIKYLCFNYLLGCSLIYSGNGLPEITLTLFKTPSKEILSFKKGKLQLVN